MGDIKVYFSDYFDIEEDVIESYGAAEKSAAFSYGDYPVGTRPAGLVINKRAGRRYR